MNICVTEKAKIISTVDELTDFINKNSDDVDNVSNVEKLNDFGLRFRYLMMNVYK